MKFKDFTLREKLTMLLFGPWIFIGEIIKTLYRGIRYNNWE